MCIIPAWSLKNKEVFRIGLVDYIFQYFEDNKLSPVSSTTFTGRKPYSSMEPSTVSLLVLLPLVLNPHEESDPCQGRHRAQTQPQLAVARTHF